MGTVVAELVTLGDDYLQTENPDYDQFNNLRFENGVFRIKKLGNFGELLLFLNNLRKAHLNLKDKNSELKREIEILKDQIRKHACFENCEKRLQRI